MIALLSTLAPLILQLGLGLISFLIKDGDAKKQAQVNFTAWIKQHFGDGAVSVDQHNSYQQQLDDLSKANDGKD